jgi:hypothetical protein
VTKISQELQRAGQHCHEILRSLDGHCHWSSRKYFSGRVILWSESIIRKRNTIKRSDDRMGLDLLLFQADKDGDPELIKQSQRARYKSEAIVDEIQEDYKQWTRGIISPLSFCE